MLIGIPAIIPPELLYVLDAMGHGDELVLADGNFPSESQGAKVIRCDGSCIPELLEAILQLFPIDTYVDQPITMMAVNKGDDYKPVIWDKYKAILAEKGCDASKIEHIGRFDFYDRVKKHAFAIVATREPARYANIILKKGVIKPAE